MTDGPIQRDASGCYSSTLLITGLLATPTELTRGIAIERQDLKTLHEEVDLIMVQQAYQKVLDHQVDIVFVICDETDVLVVLTYFYWKLDLSSSVYMQGTSTERNIFDVRKTIRSNEGIVTFIVAAHSLLLRHCCPVLGKMTVVKRLKDDKKLSLLRQLDSNIDDVIKEATLFISDCYRFQPGSMTKCCIMSWYTKASKARKTVLPLQSLPPTDKSFKENVKRMHLQPMVWYATVEVDPPAVDPTLYGWRRGELNKVLVPIGLPDSVAAAPDKVLNMVKCGYNTSSPCKNRGCSCASARVPCSLICSCSEDTAICQNEVAKRKTKEDDGSDDDES